MKSNNIKYFPFSPNIPWHVRKSKYIVPKLDPDSLDRALDNRNVVVVGFGGLIESYFSISILEAINKIDPSKKLYWVGDNRFNILCHQNGLAKIFNKNIDYEIIKKYPVPLFMDKNENVFFNYLNNYINVKSYNNRYEYNSQIAILKQLFSNALLDWDETFSPKIRNNFNNIEFDNWCKLERFNINKPFIIILPDKTNLSNHDTDCLNWSIFEIRSLIAMLNQAGIQTIICTNKTQQYHGIRANILTLKLDWIVNLIQYAKAILSRDIDFLFISMLSSNAKIISLKQSKELSLGKNKKYIYGKDGGPEVIATKELKPYDVFMEINK